MNKKMCSVFAHIKHFLPLNCNIHHIPIVLFLRQRVPGWRDYMATTSCSRLPSFEISCFWISITWVTHFSVYQICMSPYKPVPTWNMSSLLRNDFLPHFMKAEQSTIRRGERRDSTRGRTGCVSWGTNNCIRVTCVMSMFPRVFPLPSFNICEYTERVCVCVWGLYLLSFRFTIWEEIEFVLVSRLSLICCLSHIIPPFSLLNDSRRVSSWS